MIVISVVVFAFFCGGGWVYCRCWGGKSQRGRVVREAAPQRTAAIIAFRVRETEVRTVSRAPATNYPPSPPPYDNQGLDYTPPQRHQLAPQPKYAMPSPPPQPGYPPAQTGLPARATRLSTRATGLSTRAGLSTSASSIPFALNDDLYEQVYFSFLPI